MAQEWILQVSDLNEYVRRTLAADPMLRSVKLRGEISNFKRHTSGHWYFTLKDDRARIACVMFRQHAMNQSIHPQEGMQVILHGSVSLYAEGGAYQFYAEAMRPDGQGSLWQQFEALKARLAAEGLFDPGRKRFLPVRPRKIAVITAETGAVLQDIRRVSARRDASIPLMLLPVRVQGAGAAEEIAAALHRASQRDDIDVIIVGRGGGSMEDLWAFNEEIVVRAIAACRVPVISAVGHETDFTLSDFAADVRASTPSNAAELAVPDRSELLQTLQTLRKQLERQAVQAIEQARLRLNHTKSRLTAAAPDKQLAALQSQTTMLRIRLDRAMDAQVQSAAPRLAMAAVRLDNAVDHQLERRAASIAPLRARLEAVMPLRVLDRGYAMVTHQGKVIATAQAARQHREMCVTFRDGSVQVIRQEVEYNGSEEKAEL